MKNYADLLAGVYFGIVFHVAGSARSEGVRSKKHKAADVKNYADLLAGAYFGIVFQVAGSATSEGVGSKKNGLATRQPT